MSPSTMSTPELITRTGRVQNWIDEPHGRLPVSCTVFVVEDTMEDEWKPTDDELRLLFRSVMEAGGTIVDYARLVAMRARVENGIQGSWIFASHALRYGAGCAVHLSHLRPAGEVNSHGLMASGPVSFAKVYSVINEILRRGGQYKNGAVTLHLDWCHPDIEDRIIDGRKVAGFLNTPRSELPWVKRCVDVPEGIEWIEDFEKRGILDDLLKAIARGDVWLNKIKYGPDGERIYGNVCLEVYLKSRATCLLQHVNLGACTIDQIPEAFKEGMKQLIELHPRTGVGDSGQYLTPDKDRQVGLGVLGFANFLAQEGLTYRDMVAPYEADSKSSAVWGAILEGIKGAADLARKAGMERAFCIAPTASCAYRSVDRRGFACAPEIAPPVARTVDRDSGTFGVETVQYPPDIEIASEVGYEVFREAADCFVTLLHSTGLFHGYSLNSWSDEVIYDKEFLEDWALSPQTSLYYSLQVAPDTQAKDDVMAAMGDSGETPAAIFGFEDDESGSACSMDDPGFCAACAE